MKSFFTRRMLLVLQLLIIRIMVFAVPDVTVSSTAVAASNLTQGSTINVLYIAQMSVATDPVTVNNVQVTLSGTHDADDLGFLRVYFNATTPAIAGATLLNYVSGTFAAPHTYTITSLNQLIAAGSTGYFIIAVDVNNAATHNNTIKVNGASNPLVFGYSAAPNLTNSQTDVAGTQTIQAANVTISSSAVAASNLTQGSTINVLYIAQMSVSAQAVTVNNVQLTLSGTHDADDLGFLRVYFNATTPTIAGATLLNYVSGTFAAPHTYTITSLGRLMAAGSTGYFIIAVDVENAATHNNTIKVNGAANPLVFGYSTSPNITNSQTDAAGIQTIQAADVTISSTAVAASNLTQGSTINVLYIAQMSVSTQAVTVNNVQLTLSGTHDADDLGFLRVYFNATTPTFAGATLLNYVSGTFAAPHTYTITSLGRLMAPGSTGYFIIAVDVENAATHNNNIKVNGATNPLVFGYSTAPNITNSQTDAAGIQTIQAADVTLSSTAVAASNLTQGSTINVLYIAQMSVSTQAVTVNNVQLTLSGTHDADDLGFLRVYFNATAPTIAGATLLNYVSGTFVSPHTYTITSLGRLMAAGSTGYFIIAVDVNNSATHNNTIKVNGATNPLVFGYSTAPNITNSQTDAAGIQTIQAADVTLSSTAVAASNLTQGSTINVLYIAQMSVSTQAVTVNNVQLTLSGTHDADDLGFLRVYFNATAPTIAGATLLNYVSGTFAAPHTYTITSLGRLMTAGSTGYFIIAVDVNNAATHNNTIKVNGATNPLVFGYSTAPNITNSQTDAAGIQTIQAADVTLSSTAVAASNILPGSNINVLYIAQMNVTTQAVTVNNVQLTLSGTHDADDLGFLRVYFNATTPTIAGAMLLNYVSGSFAAPHTYTITSLGQLMAAGSTGYFLIAVDVNALATLSNTVKVNGATDPLVFGYSTAPNITNSQTDAAGTKTISSTLPVSLVSFTAKVENKKVHLQWKTASEINNAFFDVEHSSDGVNFTKIGRIAGKGTTNLEQNYQFFHDTPGYGNNYYQLKQIDIDNRYQYSGIVQAFIKINRIFVSDVYPNPVKNTLKFSVLTPENNKILIQISDIAGRLVLHQQQYINNGENKLQLNVSHLTGGIYNLQITDQTGGNVSTHKLVVANR